MSAFFPPGSTMPVWAVTSKETPEPTQTLALAGPERITGGWLKFTVACPDTDPHAPPASKTVVNSYTVGTAGLTFRSAGLLVMPDSTKPSDQIRLQGGTPSKSTSRTAELPRQIFVDPLKRAVVAAEARWPPIHPQRQTTARNQPVAPICNRLLAILMNHLLNECHCE